MNPVHRQSKQQLSQEEIVILQSLKTCWFQAGKKVKDLPGDLDRVRLQKVCQTLIAKGYIEILEESIPKVTIFD